MWSISGDEDSDPGTKIAQALWELDNEGCYVDIVADQIADDEHGPAPRAAAEAIAGGDELPRPGGPRVHTATSRTVYMRRTC